MNPCERTLVALALLAVLVAALCGAWRVRRDFRHADSAARIEQQAKHWRMPE